MFALAVASGDVRVHAIMPNLNDFRAKVNNSLHDTYIPSYLLHEHIYCTYKHNERGLRGI